MITIAVLILMLASGSVWGGAHPSNGAPQSFQLICPNDVVVDCDEDLSDLSKWGDAYVLKDYKRLSAGHPVVTDDRNSCGIGVITRTWRVQDPYHKWLTCTQVIEVKGGGAFTYDDIIWPEDWTIDTCSINTHPGNLPTIYSYPRFKNVDCAMPAYSYRDEVFDFSETCTKIIRYWKVLDWCTYKPGGRTGIFERPQVIKIEKGGDTLIFECPKDTTFLSQDCDSADVTLEDIFAVTSCGDTIEVRNTSPYADSPIGPATGKYPIGTHTFYYVADYGCAREEKCQVTVTVVDAKAPTPYCKNGIIITLMPIDTNADGTIDDGMREIWASDLNAGSFHACDQNRKLTYSFSSDTSDKVRNYTCENLGKNDVEIWVTDEFGNQSFCLTYIMVQNNNPRLTDCEPDSLRGGTIKGAVAMVGGMAIQEVEMEVVGERAAMSVTTTTDTIDLPNGGYLVQTTHDTTWTDLVTKSMVGKNGDYRFRKLPMYHTYHVNPSRGDDHLNGVDIWDYYTLYFHLTGFYRFQHPWQYLAADVNGDGQINMSDASDLIVSILDATSSTSFEGWRFYEDEQYGSWSQGSIMPLPESNHLEMASLTEKINEVMWTGVKVGDFDASANPLKGNLPTGIALRGVRYGTWQKTAPMTYQLALGADIVAGDVLLSFGSVTPADVNVEGEAFVMENNGDLRVLWTQHTDEAKILTFTFDREPEGLEVVLSQNVVYTHDGTPSRLAIKDTDGDLGLELLNVFPNPVHDILQLEWKGYQSEDAQVTIYDMYGRMIRSVSTGSFDTPVSVAQINVEDLEPGATYFIKINQGDAYCTGSFVKH